MTSTSVADELPWLKTSPHIAEQMESFITKIKRRDIQGPNKVSKVTAELLRNVVGSCHWSTALQLIEKLRALGRVLVAAQPLELAIGNIVRRVLYIVREEYVKEENADGSKDAGSKQLSMQNLLMPELRTNYATKFGKKFRGEVVAGVEELLMELHEVHQPISDLALEHIHTDDVVLTCGRSRTIIEFLLAAGRRRRFTVVVADTAPSFSGHELALELSKAENCQIDVTVVTDAAVFALMSRCDRVLLPADAVMANGGVVTVAGGHMVALAARHYAVPLVCVTGLYKLTPQFPHDLDAITDLQSPAAVLGFEEDAQFANVDVVNPGHDYIPPELVTLFITNFGGHQPTYIYRLLAEYYDPEDYDLSDPTPPATAAGGEPAPVEEEDGGEEEEEEEEDDDEEDDDEEEDA